MNRCCAASDHCVWPNDGKPRRSSRVSTCVDVSPVEAKTLRTADAAALGGPRLVHNSSAAELSEAVRARVSSDCSEAVGWPRARVSIAIAIGTLIVDHATPSRSVPTCLTDRLSPTAETASPLVPPRLRSSLAKLARSTAVRSSVSSGFARRWLVATVGEVTELYGARDRLPGPVVPTDVRLGPAPGSSVCAPR